MSSEAATLTETAEPAVLCEGAADWARQLLDQQLRLLGRLAQAGLEIALVAEAEAKRPEADVDAMTRAYARVSRAARQAVMLQSRLVKDFDARAAAADQARAGARVEADKARSDRVDLRKVCVSRILERVVRAGCDNSEEIERLTGEADERLDDDGLLGDVLCRPVSEIVADICKDLDLAPDWTRLAEEAWAQEEIGSGEAGWPLHPTSPIATAMAGGEPVAGERLVEGEGLRRDAASSPVRDSS